MARTLFLLRHGKSRHDATFETDFERPLAPRGTKAAKRMGQLLGQLRLRPALIVTSTAVRALSTAQIVRDELGDVPLVEDEELYAADARVLLDYVRRLPDTAETVLQVGHNPGLEDLLDLLTAQYDAVLKTCSLAVVESPVRSWDQIEEGGCTLAELYHPRELEHLQ
jgi:phosphohistidine phosphatase